MHKQHQPTVLQPVLPDVLQNDLNIVFCGTAASRISAERGYNYANPGNLFWPTLKQLNLIPQSFDPASFRTLPQFGLGLTDLCKFSIGNDDELQDSAFDTEALRQKIKKYQPRFLAFTSKTGASIFLDHKVEYGLQPERIGTTQLFALPSTSGRARRFFDKRWWQELVAATGVNGFAQLDLLKRCPPD